MISYSETAGKAGGVMLVEYIRWFMIWLLIPIIGIITAIEDYFSTVSLPIFLVFFFATMIVTYFLARKSRFYWYCPLIGLLVGFSVVGVIDWYTLPIACYSGVVPALLGIGIGKWLQWLKLN